LAAKVNSIAREVHGAVEALDEASESRNAPKDIGMLIGFSLRNFRSFLDEQCFVFAASPDRTHESTHCVRTGMKSVPRLSKSAIIFGPNGSGKTNFVIALQTLRDLVLHSTAYSEAQFAALHTPFQFGPSALRPTEFQIDLLIEKVRYRYAVSFNAQRICAERLLVYKTGKAQRWFERHYDESSRSEEWTAFSPNFNGPREMWRKATRSKALFLTTAAQLNSEQLKPVLHWFEHSLEIISPAETADFSRIAVRIQDAEFKARVLRLLNAVGIKVEDVRIADPDGSGIEASAARSAALTHAPHGNSRTQVEFQYSNEGWPAVWLESEYEAAGIQRLFGLIGPLLSAIESAKLLVVDDFDANLHPLIARFLVTFVNDPNVSDRGAQLLLVSHNTTLMDLDMLRRDEIWLTELNGAHATTLNTVLRSSPRKHEHIAKGYLRGRYGAIPEIQPDIYRLALKSAGNGRRGRAKFGT
jgi:predicted ATPase